MTPEPPRRRGMTIKEVAEEAGFSVATIVRLIRDGRIPAFRLPGRYLGDGRTGPKGLRIWSDDWERFRRAHTIVEATPEAKEAARVQAISHKVVPRFVPKAVNEGPSLLWPKGRPTG